MATVSATQGPPKATNEAPVKAAEAASTFKRTLKKRKLPDRSVPEKVAHIVPESHLYLALLDYQRRVDSLLAHKKADIREALVQPDHVLKKLRLYVYNTHEHQPRAGMGNEREPPSWTLVLSGRMLDPAAASSPAGAAAAATATSPTYGHSHLPGHSGRHSIHHLTQVFRRVEVTLDPDQFPSSSGTIVWEKTRHSGPHRDALEIRRIGVKDVNAKISLEVDWQPQRFALPPSLAILLGVQYETRTRVLSSIWTYIKSKKLQDPKQPYIINLDGPLRAVFGEDQMKLGSFAERLTPLLAPVPPIKLEYTIKLDGKSPTAPAIYDIDYALPSYTPGDRLASFLEASINENEVDALDARINVLLRRLNERRRRRAFFLGFAQSPVHFIHALLASQARDLRVSKNSNGRDFDVERRTEGFKQRWVEDAATRYLQKKVTGGH